MDIIQLILSVAAIIAYFMQWRRQAVGLSIAAALLHALVLGLGLYPDWQLQLGTLLSLFMLMTFIMCRRMLESAAMRRLLLVCVSAAVVLPLMLPAAAVAAFSLHAVLALVVYALAAAAFLLCLDLQLIENRFRREPQNAAAVSLLGREKTYFTYVLLSFIFLTFTLFSGVLADIRSGEAVLELTHKKIFTLLTWLTFLVLLIGRHFAGWRGQTARNWFLTGYAFLLLSYIGTTIIKEFVLGR